MHRVLILIFILHISAVAVASIISRRSGPSTASNPVDVSCQVKRNKFEDDSGVDCNRNFVVRRMSGCVYVWMDGWMGL